MKKGTWLIAALAGATVGATAVAAPKPVGAVSHRKNVTVMGPHVTDGAPWSDNFNSYAAGSGIIGQGSWEGWSGTVPPPEGFVSNAFAASAPNSMRMTIGNGTTTSNTDAVQVFAVTGGQWKFSGKTYIPSSTTGTGYWIILNTYPAFNWSVQIPFNSALGTVTADQVQAGTPTQLNTVTMVKDAWVTHETLIDLDTLTYTFKYNNQIVIENGGWGAINTLQALDCYSDSIVDMYYDDLNLASDSCYADCNASGSLTVADFGCFQTRFVAGDPYADCNNSGTLTVADFGCFQTQFVAGCP
jgi:hypothetical protein